MLRSYLEEIGFQGAILTPQGALSTMLIQVPMEELARRASVLIFDFGFDLASEEGANIRASVKGYQLGKRKLKDIMKAFFCILKYKKSIRPDTKWIGINVAQTDFEPLFKHHLTTQTDALITGISCGYLLSKKRTEPIQLRSAKKNLLSTLNYGIIRYFFDYSDSIRKLLLHSKISNYIAKKAFDRSLR